MYPHLLSSCSQQDFFILYPKADMLKRLITIYLPMLVVISVAFIAGRQLYYDNDVTLDDVAFVESSNTLNSNANVVQPADESLNTEQIPEDAVLVNTETVVAPVDAVETEPVKEIVEPVAVTEPEAEVVTQNVVVTISGPGITKRCVVTYTDDLSVHQLMQQASQQCNFAYRVKDYTSLGAFVDELGGVTSSRKEGRYWIYYVNGKKANVGVSSYTVAPDDLVAWVYEQEY